MDVGGLADAATARWGVLGGTFDPPHRMHLAMARAAMDQLRLTRVLFIPAGDPWRKAHARVSPAADRLAMTRLAVASEPGFACSDMELRRPGPTYTLDTLAALRAQRGPALWFILGADAVLDLPNWHAPQRLVELARLAVVARPGAEVDPASLDAILPGLAARVDWLALAADPLSATALRRRIAAGEPGGGEPGGGDAAPAVVEYARRRGLYDGPEA